MSHPQGVQPEGNQLLGTHGISIRAAGLGDMHLLSDELILAVLANLDAATLASKALHCFAMHDDIWRQLVLLQYQGDWDFMGTWRATHIHRQGLCSVAHGQQGHGGPNSNDSDASNNAALDCMCVRASRGLHIRGMYSDLLYQPHRCATAPMLDAWLGEGNIPRVQGLSLEEFREQYEVPNRPVIFTDVVGAWPASALWSDAYLAAALQDHSVMVGDYPMRFSRYLTYSERCGGDEMPLYLFDKHFADKAPQLGHDYQVPVYFQDDLFDLLPSTSRPDHRWLIMGPVRSGSSWHQDPNKTSAWNGVVRGSKKWVMMPPTVMPAGVHASADGADVATPVSLVEWFLDFYEEASQQPGFHECIVRAGEMLFVPRGWWHLAINLEPSVAVTQNFVSPVTLPHTAAFLSTRSQALVSGLEEDARGGLYDRLVEALEVARPELLAVVQQQQDRFENKRKQTAALQAVFDENPAKKPASFSFGFQL